MIINKNGLKIWSLHLAFLAILFPVISLAKTTAHKKQQKIEQYCDSDKNKFDSGTRAQFVRNLASAKTFASKWQIMDQIKQSLQSESEAIDNSDDPKAKESEFPILFRIELINIFFNSEPKIKGSFGKSSYKNICDDLQNEIRNADKTNINICPTRWSFKVLDALCPGNKYLESYNREPVEEELRRAIIPTEQSGNHPPAEGGSTLGI